MQATGMSQRIAEMWKKNYIVVIELLMLSFKINYAELPYSATVMHHLHVEQYKAECIVESLIEEAIIHYLYAGHKNISTGLVDALILNAYSSLFCQFQIRTKLHDSQHVGSVGFCKHMAYTVLLK